MSVKEITKDRKEIGADIIEKAFNFASLAHEGQKRLSGEDYMIHLFEVARSLSDLNMDTDTIVAGLLHDTLEDTKVTEAEIEKEFGKNVLFLVQGATKIQSIENKESKATSHKTLMKLFLATAEDIRVILIKLADRLHNLRTIRYLPPNKQKRMALESIKIYGPIAERLNMGDIKGEIEDLSFPYAFPGEYKDIINKTRQYFDESKTYAAQIKPKVEEYLRENYINDFKIDSRVKHYFSLYKKLSKLKNNLDAIHDLVAFRIILPDISQCYAVLGILHKKYLPLPKMIKDYIALPKPNGYQSLHTTVFCEDGRIVEFQIRTKDMHEHAENGIAAHWHYSESDKKGTHAEMKELEWVSKIKQWRQASQEEDPKDFFDSLKLDLFKERIFVFTPDGDVKDLPLGATPIDFAYSIHSEIGDRCYGAKVNGKLVSIGHQLKNGDVCQIITSKKQKPSLDWIKIAKTSEARSRIKSILKKG